MQNHIKRLLPATFVAMNLIAGKSYAQSPGLEITIEMKGFPTSETVEKNTYNFLDICNAFAANLTRNHGLLGTGPFDSATCSQAGKATSAKSTVKNQWLLRIYGNESAKNFEVLWRDQSGKEISQAKYTLETEAGPLAILAKKSTNAMIAYYLTTAMPFRSTISADMVREGKTTIEGPIGPLWRIQPPTSLALFTLTRVDDIWQTKSAGLAKLTLDTGKQASWKPEQLPASAGANYFAQQTENRRDTLHQVDMLIQSDVDNFADKFLTLGRAGYVGVRFGVPIIGVGVLKKAKLIGLFGEFRSGILAGLKLNYDFTPVQKYATDLGATSYAWSRFQMGYGFSRALSNKFFNWFDATPRIGFTTLELHYTPNYDTTPPYEFILKKAPTVGLELGLESRTEYFMARLWTFSSLSVPILKIDRKHSTNSIRAGLDFYRQIFSLKHTNFAALLFGAVDSTFVSKQLTQSEIENSQAKNIRNTSFYIGGGTTLTW